MKQYIDKSALVAEIEKWVSGWTERLNNTNPSNPSFFEGGIEVGKHILSFLNTIEVKEVDLEKEFDNYTKNIMACDVKFEPFTHLYNCAKHFYELGINTRKENE